MNKKIEEKKGWRGSRDVWLNVAFKALVEKGVDAVKIQPLATSLNLARTSFYWHFKDRKDLLDALMNEWNIKNTGAILSACKAESENEAEAALNVISVFLDSNKFDTKLDFAMRGWALKEPEVLACVKQADETRLTALRQMMINSGSETLDADVRARTMYLVQIGYISMQFEESLETRMKRIPAYVHTFSGITPSESILARFYAKHNYCPD